MKLPPKKSQFAQCSLVIYKSVIVSLKIFRKSGIVNALQVNYSLDVVIRAQKNVLYHEIGKHEL